MQSLVPVKRQQLTVQRIGLMRVVRYETCESCYFYFLRLFVTFVAANLAFAPKL
jgi:hypothetical protein